MGLICDDIGSVRFKPDNSRSRYFVTIWSKMVKPLVDPTRDLALPVPKRYPAPVVECTVIGEPIFDERSIGNSSVIALTNVS